MAGIDYYFSLASPWTYLGHAVFVEIAGRHRVQVRFKPVLLGPVFEQTGGLPLPKRHPVRQRYRLVELQRWREARGIALNLHPAHWPFDPSLPDRVAIAIAAGGGDPEPYVRAAMTGVWAGDLDLSGEETVAGLLAEAGHDPASIMTLARGPEAEATYARHRDEALSAGVFGAPSYVRDGEVFWGQDRLDLLDRALASGRPAFRAEG